MLCRRTLDTSRRCRSVFLYRAGRYLLGCRFGAKGVASGNNQGGTAGVPLVPDSITVGQRVF